MSVEKENSIHLMGMQVENFCRVKLSQMAPLGASVKISGKNRQGKTSNANALWVGMGGSDAMKELGITKPVHGDSESAKINLDLGEILVHRELTPEGQTKKLLVTTKEGFKLEPGQTVLDRFRGKFYDLSQFYRMDSDKRLELVLSLIDLGGLDLKEWKAGRKAVFDERTAVNNEHKKLKARLDASPEVEAPDEEISISDIATEQQEAQDLIDENNLLRLALKGKAQDRAHCNENIMAATQAVTDIEGQITQLENQIAQLKTKKTGKEETLTELKAELVTIQTDGKALQLQVDAIKDPDMSGYSERIGDVEKINARVRAKKARAELAADLEAKLKEADNLTLKLKAFDRRKEKAIKEADFPVEGLGFDDSDITYNDMPFSQSSDMERLVIGYGIAKVLSPRFKVLRLSRPGDLDPENLEHLYTMAAHDDIQILTELVSDGTGGDLIIEDGILEAGTTAGVEKIIEEAKPKRQKKAEATAAAKETGKVVTDAELDAIYQEEADKAKGKGKTAASKDAKPAPVAAPVEL